MTKDAEADLIERVYDAALAEDGWGPLAEELVRVFHGNNAALLTQDNHSGYSRFHASTVGISTQTLENYATYYGPRSPLFHVYKHTPIGRTYTDADYTDYRRYRNSEIYNDFYAPLQAEHLLGVDLESQVDCSTYLVIRRGQDSGFFSRADAETLDRIAPHLSKALKLDRLVADGRDARATAEGLLHSIERAAVLADATGRITAMNARAERLLADKDGLTVTNGRLRTGHVAQQRALDHLIAQADRSPGGEAADGNAMLVLKRREKRTPLIVDIHPLPLGRGVQAGNPVAILRLIDPEERTPIDVDTIIAMFGLTRAEAAIAATLCAGGTVAGHAADAGITRNTARTLLRNAMAKTETHKQSELVSLILSALPR
jgi:DNA-binding CsgD family transcriptional regulator